MDERLKFVAKLLDGEKMAVVCREFADKIWLVSFLRFYLGFFDQDESRVEPAPNPFIPKLLPMSSV